jgi:hypothetical protein
MLGIRVLKVLLKAPVGGAGSLLVTKLELFWS